MDDFAPVIETRRLTKIFGDCRAASDISLTVRRGEIFGLIGPNGAGKSTLIKMLTTLLRPTTGTSIVVGHDIGADPAKALKGNNRRPLPPFF